MQINAAAALRGEKFFYKNIFFKPCIFKVKTINPADTRKKNFADKFTLNLSMRSDVLKGETLKREREFFAAKKADIPNSKKMSAKGLLFALPLTIIL